MRIFKKVAIVGTGLIGGSLALEIRKRGLARDVVGVSRRRSSLVWAKKMGAIDKGSQSLDILKGADLVVLATPVNVIMKLAVKISKIIPSDCLVMDVGSTKEEIVRELEKIFDNYIGSHPLAGSEKRGINHARKDLFKGSLCILTPTRNTCSKALSAVNKLWKSLGAKTVLLDPAAHDRLLSFVSHLPHVVAFSLISTVPEAFLRFASGGLKDTTRIAASDSELWSQIFFSNRRNIVCSIDKFQDNLTTIKSAIQKRDEKKLTLFLNRAKEKRNRLL
jgi:prephenate dehydrogenase